MLLKRVLTHLKESGEFDERTEKMIQAAARLSPQTERARKFEDTINPQSKPDKSAISQQERLNALKELGITPESEAHHD